MNLQDKCAQIAVWKQLQEDHIAAAATLGGMIDEVGKELFDDFADSGTAESLRVPGKLFKDGQSRLVKPTLKYKPSIIQVPVFFAWMRDRNHGALIKEGVHPKTLESWVTKQMEGNFDLPSTDTLAVYKVQGASVRRAPKSS